METSFSLARIGPQAGEASSMELLKKAPEQLWRFGLIWPVLKRYSFRLLIV